MVAGVAFFGALLGIGSLLLLKRWENIHAYTLFPEVRRTADVYALTLKAFIFNTTKNLNILAPFFLHFLQHIVRVSAITFGHLAHWLGRRSHELADFVSHKYRFERRETRSEFLKKVIEHPMKPATRTVITPIVTPALQESLDVSSVSIATPAEMSDIHIEKPLMTEVSDVALSARLTRVPSLVGKTLVGATRKIRRKRRVSKPSKTEEVPVVVAEP